MKIKALLLLAALSAPLSVSAALIDVTVTGEFERAVYVQEPVFGTNDAVTDFMFNFRYDSGSAEVSTIAAGTATVGINAGFVAVNQLTHIGSGALVGFSGTLGNSTWDETHLVAALLPASLFGLGFDPVLTLEESSEGTLVSMRLEQNPIGSLWTGYLTCNDYLDGCTMRGTLGFGEDWRFRVGDGDVRVNSVVSTPIDVPEPSVVLLMLAALGAHLIRR